MDSEALLSQRDGRRPTSSLRFTEPLVTDIPRPHTLTPPGANFSEREREALASFVEQLARVQHSDSAYRLDDLRRIFADTMSNLGFKHFTYHVVRSTGVSDNGRLPYFISTYPEKWVQHYLREHYLDEDPVVTTLLQAREPFMWSQIAQPDVLSARQRRLLDEARDAGLENGLTFPIHHKGEIAALSVVPDALGREGAIVMHHRRHLLHLLAWHYHILTCSVLLECSLISESAHRRSLLSPREKQVLEWAARGKSAWEISVVLGISRKSVEFHFEGAKRKLHVFNRTHAVAKAIMLGLLSSK